MLGKPLRLPTFPASMDSETVRRLSFDQAPGSMSARWSPVMSTAAERAEQLQLVARLKSAYPELPDAPTPDLLDHRRIKAYLKPVHDVGGEPDAPMKYENKQYEQWEELTYVCLLYTSPSPRDGLLSRMPSSA